MFDGLMNVTTCSLVEIYRCFGEMYRVEDKSSNVCLLLVYYYYFFDPEVGGNMFIPNIGNDVTRQTFSSRSIGAEGSHYTNSYPATKLEKYWLVQR